MKTAVSYLYKASKENIKEREEKKEWRKTYDPSYMPRRSMLAQKFENRKSRVMRMFGKPQRCVTTETERIRRCVNSDSTYKFSQRDSVATVSTVSDRGSMFRDPDRNSMATADRDSMLKSPENAYLKNRF